MTNRAASSPALSDTFHTSGRPLQEELASVGYVWRSPGTGNLREPGIPSLMSYIEATERHGGAAP